jgi:flagellar motor switch protein FliG
MMDNQRQTIREAALLVASLEQDLADTLLDRFSPTEAARLRQVMARLGDVDPDEQQRLVLQFRRARAGIEPAHDGGVILEGALADAPPTPDPAPESPRERPFCFLSGADPHTLAPFLEREHGQTAAVVLSQLPPEQAAEVLASLPAAKQVDVVRRLASLDTADEESLRVVAHELKAWIDTRQQQGRRRAAGLQAVGGILAAASPAQQRAVVANLNAADGDLARQVTDAAPSTAAQPAEVVPRSAAPTRRLDFDDLATLSPARLAALVAAAPTEIVVLALTGASDRMTGRMLDAIPPQQAATLRDRLRERRPIRLRDVEAAQQELADLAVSLETHDPTPRPPQVDPVAA